MILYKHGKYGLIDTKKAMAIYPRVLGNRGLPRRESSRVIRNLFGDYNINNVITVYNFSATSLGSTGLVSIRWCA